MAALLPHSDGCAIVMMGVAGCGKSTIGRRVADCLHVPFLEGDSFHPSANIAKMSAGIPLTDDDRWPWLDALGAALRENIRSHRLAVAACSALKRTYRQRLHAATNTPVLFVLLEGSRDLIERRMRSRVGHFMPPTLVDSQFATLELPSVEEGAIRIAINSNPQTIVETVVGALKTRLQDR